MDTERKRHRAFISYSQRDKRIARALHRSLETYRVPDGVAAEVDAHRRLGRFFRDDDEMGASQSLGRALSLASCLLDLLELQEVQARMRLTRSSVPSLAS